MAAAAAQYYFRFRIYWCHCLQNVIIHKKQISSTHLNSRLSTHYMYRNVSQSSSKSRKFRIFGKNLPIRDESPSAIFTTLGEGRESQVCSAPGSHISPSWFYRNVGRSPPKSSKYGMFGINLPLIGQFPDAIFAKFDMGRKSQIHNLATNFTFVALKM